MPFNTLTITDNRTGKAYEVPIANGAIRAMDLRQIRTGPDDFGLLSYDPAFTNTASTISRITEIDGDRGILRYRGYPIEELAERDVQRADAAADRRGQRALDPDQVFTEGVDSFVGQPRAGGVERDREEPRVPEGLDLIAGEHAQRDVPVRPSSFGGQPVPQYLQREWCHRKLFVTRLDEAREHVVEELQLRLFVGVTEVTNAVFVDLESPHPAWKGPAAPAREIG